MFQRKMYNYRKYNADQYQSILNRMNDLGNLKLE